jgi:hemoglobin
MIRLAPKLFLAALVAAGLTACQTTPPSLYDRLGGKAAISAVVDQFVANVVADPSIAPRFTKLNNEQVAKLKVHLTDQICEATGGPCKYTGRDMKTTHKGMNITTAEFNATGGALAKALDKFNVPAKEKNELLTAIGGMQPDIVGQ